MQYRNNRLSLAWAFGFILLVTGCDREVAGITFESGFMVDPGVAYQEGYQVGVVTCKNQKGSFSKYKSGTQAFAKYMEGWRAAMYANGCGHQR